MEELLRINMLSYAFVTVFTAILFFSLVFGLLKKTREIENKKKKAVINSIGCGVIICFWLWFFVYINLFPISLAYYEYNNNLVEEKSGVIESVEQEGKDRIIVIIDGVKYTIVHSSVNPVVTIGKDIDTGDHVTITFGANSKFIFDVKGLQ